MAIRLITPVQGDEVLLFTDMQKQMVESGFTPAQPGAAVDWLHLVKQRDKAEDSRSRSVEFRWEGGSAPWCFELSCQYGTIRHVTGEPVVSVNNLYVGTDYTWSVSDAEDTASGCFHTADCAPRFITVDGDTNVRDLGGWRGLEDRRVRQGLVYRGSEFDSHLNVTEKGIRTLVDELKIKTDFDMRGEVVGKRTESVLSPHGVNWQLIPLRPYAEIADDEAKKAYRRAFDLFLNPANYPIYVHCWGGADRTGTFCFLLEAVLGVEDEDLMRDFELTTLSLWGERSWEQQLAKEFLAYLDTLGGERESYQEKAVRYVCSLGISDAELEQLRDTLLEQK